MTWAQYRTAATLAAALCAALLAGCVSTPPAGVPLAKAKSTLQAKWQTHKTRVAAVHDFTVNARVATRGSFGVTGGLRWIERGDRFNVHFSGPFGSGAVDITGDPFVVTIRTAKKSYVTSQPERFLLRNFGWTLPLRGLRYWALGLPTPGTQSTLSLNTAGALRSLTQAGWKIDYSAYQKTAGYLLPRKMTMHGEKTEFRIVIDSWQGLATK